MSPYSMKFETTDSKFSIGFQNQEGFDICYNAYYSTYASYIVHRHRSRGRRAVSRAPRGADDRIRKPSEMEIGFSAVTNHIARDTVRTTGTSNRKPCCAERNIFIFCNNTRDEHKPESTNVHANISGAQSECVFVLVKSIATVKRKRRATDYA
jgi:hypothetical protein